MLSIIGIKNRSLVESLVYFFTWGVFSMIPKDNLEELCRTLFLFGFPLLVSYIITMLDTNNKYLRAFNGVIVILIIISLMPTFNKLILSMDSFRIGVGLISKIVDINTIIYGYAILSAAPLINNFDN